MHHLKLFFIIIFSLSLTPATADINHYFAAIKSNPKALYSFFKDMPKAGELHYHLIGGVSAEAMLALAAQGHYCLDPVRYVLLDANPICQGIKANEIRAKSPRYNQIIQAWSMQNFVPGVETAHHHFFACFDKFIALLNKLSPQLLANVMQRAADQRELYLEIMIMPDHGLSTTFAKFAHGKTLAEKKHALLANKDFQKNITYTMLESKKILTQARQLLDCTNHPQQTACQLTIKFQAYILREQPLDNIFAQALNSFAAAAQSKDIVAINLVQPEDGVISLRDYHAQMEIINFLHQAYPKVHITLHAGELSSTLVPQTALNFHIYDAIFTGHAERIGHGVAIRYEKNVQALLNYMVKVPIAVEINLASNHKILNISGKKHPLTYYLAHKIPVVLSSDDEGILRTDLTSQYVDAAFIYGLNYPTLKTINRNTLTYSFLPGKSLWANANQALRVSACQDINSPACSHFLNKSEKARLQWQLEQALNQFEKRFLE